MLVKCYSQASSYGSTSLMSSRDLYQWVSTGRFTSLTMGRCFSLSRMCAFGNNVAHSRAR